jgi:hypothetical protein
MSDGQPRSTALRRFLPILFAAAVILGAAGALLRSYAAGADRPGRDPDEREQAVKAPQRVLVEHGETVITLDADVQRRSGIELATLRNAAHPQRLRAYATVLDSQPLTELSARYADAEGRLRTAQAKLAASKAAFERARTLYADHENISAARLQEAEANYRVDQANLAATQSQLRMLSAGAQQAWGPVLGRALTDAAPLAVRLVERRDLLLQVTLPPGRSIVPPAHDAFVRLDGETRVPIALVSVAPRTDPHIQGASFFYTASARSALLPGMSALAYLPSGKSVEGAIVPDAAIVWTQGQASIYLRTGAQTFARHAISTAVPAPGGGYMVQGLPESAQVVVQGAQMLLSETYRAPARGGGDQD